MFHLQAFNDKAFSAVKAGKLEPKALSVIQLHLGGGMPQQESFDPKPEAPVEYRGSFGVTKTKNGDVFSDNFSETAKIANKVTIVRSIVGRIPDHGLATYHLFTGYTPTAVIDHPQMGSIVSHELGLRGDLPPYIAIPNKNAYAGGTGFLSSTYGPFEINSDPGSRSYRVRDFSIPDDVSLERIDRRQTAHQIVEQRIRNLKLIPRLSTQWMPSTNEPTPCLHQKKPRKRLHLKEKPMKRRNSTAVML